MMHPIPNQQHLKDLMSNSNGHSLVINIRDPVDRFISAFQWRQVVMCRPDDKRQNGAAWNDPVNKCVSSKKKELMLRETYKSDPSILAEALCDNSPLYEKAVEDYSMLGHRHHLVEWLTILLEPNVNDNRGGIQNLIALPLEKQGDNVHFGQHIEQLSLHLLQTRYSNLTSSNILKLKPEKNDIISKEKAEHSSRRHSNSKAVLSPLGECCMVKYFLKDYQLIQAMIPSTSLGLHSPHPIIGEACKWGNMEQQRLCTSDLESIILRRAKYIQSTSCSM